MKRVFTTAAAATAAAALLAGSVMAQELEWGDWDANGDGLLDQNEFSSGMKQHGAFLRWDSDADKRLTEEEFERGMYRDYDVNSDEAISQDELGPGMGGLGLGIGLDRD